MAAKKKYAKHKVKNKLTKNSGGPLAGTKIVKEKPLKDKVIKSERKPASDYMYGIGLINTGA